MLTDCLHYARDSCASWIMIFNSFSFKFSNTWLCSQSSVLAVCEIRIFSVGDRPDLLIFYIPVHLLQTNYQTTEHVHELQRTSDIVSLRVLLDF